LSPIVGLIKLANRKYNLNINTRNWGYNTRLKKLGQRLG
jgi:hypothetical protein